MSICINEATNYFRAHYLTTCGCCSVLSIPVLWTIQPSSWPLGAAISASLASLSRRPWWPQLQPNRLGMCGKFSHFWYWQMNIPVVPVLHWANGISYLWTYATSKIAETFLQQVKEDSHKNNIFAKLQQYFHVFNGLDIAAGHFLWNNSMCKYVYI